MAKVLVVMGSDSDFPVMEGCFKLLKKFDIAFDAKVCSAHRTPDLASRIASSAKEDGYSVIIAAAGLAAHLAGVIAAHTVLPVIGVPCKGGALHGVDALYAVVQMPTGIPVATVAIDGGSNAAILAAQMLALSDEALSKKLVEYKAGLAASVAERDARLQEKIANIGE
ncbi:MAG TPA: 5-(carboxyamino)imidazole ribonucleotide mutase [Clostridiales bacterium]|jgi:5-(carboxyamino)imidazole ribonucleotide mutase|nr:5-(carboxyamino)imidazole ribonucleotide mutase [Saccharofermentanaceae bacterium]HAU50708.1 5-(carboxyamino)imidazole ribonucleotide mutase [Clostridiales bacterium]HBY33031.1 5-(carboxyamino)imidazole ribonucleotide mutase [Clostridiales bacterium]HBZ77638.1 5-(carboxyamino)imidazole ribonucleotide mutase [Clostridiales bacterium]